MEALDGFIVDLTLILLVASVASVILKKLKQPVVLGYIIAGFLISPNFQWLPTVVNSDDVTVWANIGIIFLMFGLGLEFNFKKIAEVGKSAVITAVTVITAMVIIGYSVGQLLGWSSMTSIFLGGMLSMSSTMIILKSYEDMDLKNQRFAEVVMGVLVIEDIAGIFMMIVLSTISVSQGTPDPLSLAADLGMMVLYLLVWLVLSVFIIPGFMKKASSVINDEILLIISVTICFVMVFIANQIGFSSALGAFLGGSILSGTVYGERTEHLVKPVKDIFGAVFFVSVGMMVVPSMLVEYLVPILILTVVTILGQMIFATLGMILSGQDLHMAVRGGFSMVQIGEFSFILATLGSELGVIDDFLYPVVVCISVITTFTTPFFIKKAEAAYNFLERRMPQKMRDFREVYGNKEGAKAQDDSEWKRYIKKYVSRTLIYVVLILIVYLLGCRTVEPLIHRCWTGHLGDAVTTAIVVLCMLPFIVRLCNKKHLLHVKLWVSSTKNRLSLVTLNAFKYIYAMLFLIAAFRTFSAIPYWILVPVSAVLIAVAVRWDFLYDNTVKAEMKFIANLNEKTLEEARQERNLGEDYSWFDQRFYVRRLQVPGYWDGISLRKMHEKLFGDLNVIRVQRGEEDFLMPSADFILKAGDRLDMMGLREPLDAGVAVLTLTEHVEAEGDGSIPLHDYVGQLKNRIVCCPIKVDKTSEFCRKTIKTCGFREKYQGFIIGIERDNLPVCCPDLRMSIEKDDLLWVIGKKDMADRLLASGCLED